jgi:hypothetical protein
MPKQAFLIVLLLLGLSGCATAVSTVPADFSLGANDESVVTGQLIMDFGSGPAPKFFERMHTTKLTVVHQASGKKYKIVCDEGGREARFFVTLPPGSYRLDQWVWSSYSLDLNGSFTVGAGQVVYVGTLKWIRNEMSLELLGLATLGAVPGRLVVEDRFREDIGFFRGQYPRIRQDVVKSIIKLE